MLNKEIKITTYDRNGKELVKVRVKELCRRADGCFTSESSRVLARGVMDVENGGAMFIEQVWSK